MRVILKDSYGVSAYKDLHEIEQCHLYAHEPEHKVPHETAGTFTGEHIALNNDDVFYAEVELDNGERWFFVNQYVYPTSKDDWLDWDDIGI